MPSWLQSSDNLNKKALKEIRKWMILKKKPIIGEIPPQTEVPPVEQACNNSEKCALIPETFRSEAFWKFSMPNHAEIWLSQVELGYHSTET